MSVLQKAADASRKFAATEALDTEQVTLEVCGLYECSGRATGSLGGGTIRQTSTTRTGSGVGLDL